MAARYVLPLSLHDIPLTEGDKYLHDPNRYLVSIYEGDVTIGDRGSVGANHDSPVLIVRGGQWPPLKPHACNNT